MNKKRNIDTNKLFLDYVHTGNRDNFNKIIKHLEKKLSKRINYYLNDRDLTNDVIQEVWLRADKIKQEFDPEKGSFETWLFSKVVWGYILQAYKNSKQKKEMTIRISNKEDDEEEDFLELQKNDDLNPDELFEQKEKNLMILKILKNLEEPYQNVFILHNIAGFPLNELSYILNVPYPTIRTWHRRAKTNIIQSARLEGIM